MNILTDQVIAAATQNVQKRNDRAIDAFKGEFSRKCRASKRDCVSDLEELLLATVLNLSGPTDPIVVAGALKDKPSRQQAINHYGAQEPLPSRCYSW